MQDFSIKREDVPDNSLVVLHLTGYIDAYTFEETEKYIAGLFSQDVYRIIVNLADVGHVSSAGVGVLMIAMSHAQEHGGNLVLLSPSENVRLMFEISGVLQIFTVVESRDEAVKMFSA